MLSKSSLCVYISDGCVKRLLGWITHRLPSEEGDDGVGGGGYPVPTSSSPQRDPGRHSDVCLEDGIQQNTLL